MTNSHYETQKYVEFIQCKLTQECGNDRCFFKQRDCYGRSYWINPFESEEDAANRWKFFDQLEKDVGKLLYPTFTAEFVMNSIGVYCNHFIKKDK